jgi:hypothetical protein
MIRIAGAAARKGSFVALWKPEGGGGGFVLGLMHP